MWDRKGGKIPRPYAEFAEEEAEVAEGKQGVGNGK